MARFRLQAKHYLMTDPPTEWEQKETDQQTGKQARKVYTVPRYLDPDDPADCNYPGEIIVSTKFDRVHPRDIVIKSPPTRDMAPLDAEADAMLAKLPTGNPIDDLPKTVEIPVVKAEPGRMVK